MSSTSGRFEIYNFKARLHLQHLFARQINNFRSSKIENENCNYDGVSGLCELANSVGQLDIRDIPKLVWHRNRRREYDFNNPK